MRIPLTKEQIQELIRLFNKYSNSTVGIEYDETDTTDILSDINSSYSVFNTNYHARAKLGADLKFSKRHYNFVKVIYKILIGQLTPEIELLGPFDYPPVALPATNITDVAFDANWKSFPTAEGYIVDYSLDPTFATSTTRDAGNNLSYNCVDSVYPLSTWYYRIRAYKVVNLVTIYSPWSNRISLQTLAPVLILAPVQLDPTDIDFTEFRINWQAYTYATGYYVDIATDAGFVNLVVDNLDIPGGLVTSVLIQDMAPQDDYWSRVRAYNNVSTSPNSNVKSFNTTALPVPSANAATGVAWDRFFLEWDQVPDPGAINGFLLQVCLTADNFSPNISGWNDLVYPNSGATYIICPQTLPFSIITEDTSYSYRLRSYLYVGLTRYISDFSNVIEVTTPFESTLPFVDTLPMVSIGDTTATASGDLTKSGPWYSAIFRGITYNTTGDPHFPGDPSFDAVPSPGPLGVYTVNMTGLTAGTLYYLRAYAVNASPGTGEGDVIQFTTTSSIVLPPDTLVATANGPYQIDLTWNNGEVYDLVEVDSRNDDLSQPFSLLTTINSNATSYSNTLLDAFTNYSYRVRGHTVAGGYSAYSNIASAQTDGVAVLISLQGDDEIGSNSFGIPVELNNVALSYVSGATLPITAAETGSYFVQTSENPSSDFSFSIAGPTVGDLTMRVTDNSLVQHILDIPSGTSAGVLTVSGIPILQNDSIVAKLDVAKLPIDLTNQPGTGQAIDDITLDGISSNIGMPYAPNQNTNGYFPTLGGANLDVAVELLAPAVNNIAITVEKNNEGISTQQIALNDPGATYTFPGYTVSPTDTIYVVMYAETVAFYIAIAQGSAVDIASVKIDTVTQLVPLVNPMSANSSFRSTTTLTTTHTIDVVLSGTPGVNQNITVSGHGNVPDVRTLGAGIPTGLQTFNSYLSKSEMVMITVNIS